MDWDTAMTCFDEANAQPGEDQQLRLLQREFLRPAIRYARIRADWQLATVDMRSQMSAERTGAHNTFIEACNALSRYMASHGMTTSWRTRLGTDRKILGDFACFIHCILGLQAR